MDRKVIENEEELEGEATCPSDDESDDGVLFEDLDIKYQVPTLSIGTNDLKALSQVRNKPIASIEFRNCIFRQPFCLQTTAALIFKESETRGNIVFFNTKSNITF